MATIVVAGNGKSVGKTTLLCGLIAALAERQWTAIKITNHAYDKPDVVWEEPRAGEATDTERYLAAGARRALLISATNLELGDEKVRAALVTDRDVLIESNRVLEWVKADVCLAIVGEEREGEKASFAEAKRRADAFVAAPGGEVESAEIRDRPVFEIADFSRISQELIGWIRDRLNSSELR